jgi:hypothetical protein
MSSARHLYVFKCVKGHKTEKAYPLDTRLDDIDETTCAECLKNYEVTTAYVVFIYPLTDKNNDGTRS